MSNPTPHSQKEFAKTALQRVSLASTPRAPLPLPGPVCLLLNKKVSILLEDPQRNGHMSSVRRSDLLQNPLLLRSDEGLQQEASEQLWRWYPGPAQR